MCGEEKPREDVGVSVNPDEPSSDDAAAKEEAAEQVKQPAASRLSWGERVGYGF